jgi:hypothetical protein
MTGVYTQRNFDHNGNRPLHNPGAFVNAVKQPIVRCRVGYGFEILDGYIAFSESLNNRVIVPGVFVEKFCLTCPQSLKDDAWEAVRE